MGTALLVFVAVASVVGWYAVEDSLANHKGSHPAVLLEALRREHYLASRHGFQFGVPKQAIPRAMSQMRAMEHARAPRRVGTSKAAVPALPGAWSFLGPQPITEKANFTGSALGSSQRWHVGSLRSLPMPPG
jgi:hypothetical protein